MPAPPADLDLLRAGLCLMPADVEACVATWQCVVPLTRRDFLTEFVHHQHHLLAILDQAAGKDLDRKAVPVEFFRLLRLRNGEALLFVAAHAQRPLQQAQRAAAHTPIPKNYELQYTI